MSLNKLKNKEKLTLLHLHRMMLARFRASAVIAYLNLGFLVHISLVTLQLAGQGKARAAQVAGVRSLGRCRDCYRGGRVHDNLLLYIAGRRVVHPLVMRQQAHVSEHEAANVALEGRGGGRCGGNADLIQQSVVAAHRLHVEAITALVVGGQCPNGAHRVCLHLLQHIDVVVEWEFRCGGLLDFLILLLGRHVHLLGLLLL